MTTTTLQTWTIKYTAIPTAYNRPQVARVEAATAADALALLLDQLRECYDTSRPQAYTKNYVVQEPQAYVAPAVAGRVLSLSHGDE